MQKPFRGRAVIEERSDSLLVQIPTAKSWWLLLFLPFWFVAWVWGGSMFLRSFLEGRSGSGSGSAPSLFAIVWIIGWVIASGFVLYTWLRLMFGVEVTEFTPHSISVGEKILTIEPGSSYDARSISRLRTLSIVAPSIFDNTELRGGLLTVGYGKVDAATGTAKGNPIPTLNVPAWGSAAPSLESAVFAAFKY
jgi:hypothetical protein